MKITGRCYGGAIGFKFDGEPLTALVVKVGTFEEPSVFEPSFAQYLKDAPPFHLVPERLQAYQETRTSL